MGNKITSKNASSQELTAKDIALLKSTFKMDDNQIQNMHANFMRDYPSGRMDKAGLVRFYKRVLPNNQKMDTVSDHVFATFDKNHDGTIDFREFMLTVVAAAPRDLDAQLNFVFDTCDVSGDGHMDFEELVDFFKTALNLAGASELANDQTVVPIVTGVFQALGVSEDGKINKEQFFRGCKNDPELRKLFGARNCK